MDQFATGNIVDARTLLEWVKKNGNVSGDEYALALTFLAKCDTKKH
jgi:hypothetical protein